MALCERDGRKRRRFNVRVLGHEAVYRILTQARYELGTAISGVVYSDKNELWLREVSPVSAPNEPGSARPAIDGQPSKGTGSDASIRVHSVAVRLRTELQTWQSRYPRLAAAIGGAADALDCDKPMSATAILALVVLTTSVPVEVRAFCAPVLFGMLKIVGLEKLGPIVNRGLSRGVLAAMKTKDRSRLQQDAIRMEMNTTSKEDLRRLVSRWQTEEAAFVQTLALRLSWVPKSVQYLAAMADV